MYFVMVVVATLVDLYSCDRFQSTVVHVTVLEIMIAN
jgi:hypothetical protein